MTTHSITFIDDLIQKFHNIVFDRVNRYPTAFTTLSSRIKYELRKRISECQKCQLQELYEALQQEVVVEPSVAIARKYANEYPASFAELLK